MIVVGGDTFFCVVGEGLARLTIVPAGNLPLETDDDGRPTGGDLQAVTELFEFHLEGGQ